MSAIRSETRSASGAIVQPEIRWGGPLGPYNVDLQNAGNFRGARSTVYRFKSAADRNAYMGGTPEELRRKREENTIRFYANYAKRDKLRSMMAALRKHYDSDDKGYNEGLAAGVAALESGASGEQAAAAAIDAADKAAEGCIGKACKAMAGFFTKKVKTEGGKRKNRKTKHRKTKRHGRK